AAQHADIIGLAPRLLAPSKADLRSVLAEETAEKIEWVRRAAGARFATLELNTYPCLGPIQVTNDRRAAAQTLAEQLRQRYGAELGVDELLDSPHVFLGTVEQLAQKCLELRERFGITYLLVLGDKRAFAPVIEQLT
ncbi:MAG: LLM class F420-dependent oxidoreductase, partial [Chloroflexota bacterium]|nr:LLM class F420-dependent oxidoreductase [Chloroflexota bacterium]